MKKQRKMITAVLLAGTMIGVQLLSAYGVQAASTTSGSTGNTTSSNITEGNWVYSINSNQTNQGQNQGNGNPAGNTTGSGNAVPSGMPPQGGMAPSGTPPQGGTAPSGTPPQGTNPGIPSSSGNSTNAGNSSSSSSKKTATILWGTGSEKNGNVVMLPAVLGGYQVTVLGNGAQNISSNNKTSDNYVLIPEGITTLSNHMIYDYNSTSGWSIPSTITSIADGAFLSCPGTFYGVKGSAAETYASLDSTRKFITYTKDGSTEFTASSASQGYMQPNGTYHLPSGMLDGKHKITISIVSKYQYKIKKLTVDGKVIKKAAGKNTYEFNYTFTKTSKKITVTYTKDSKDKRDPDTFSGTYSYKAPTINKKAVTKSVNTKDQSLYTYAAVNTGSTGKYENTMGISTGAYYSADGKVYKMVYSSQKKNTPEYYSKAEVINGMYKSKGYVYGKDYDLIRLYNYYENVTSGPSQGEVALYCTYLYKEINTSDIKNNTIYNSKTNTASLFVQKGADLILKDFTTHCYTASTGPSEAGNFFGLGSCVQIDGGDAVTPASTVINKNTAKLTLYNPNILGTVNSIYAAANGVGYIQGGNIFSCTSGGHGPYVSSGGQILLNTLSTNLVDSSGNVNKDISKLTATARPSSELGTMSRINGKMQGVFSGHSDDQTVIVTGDESGTALATDTGGGVIVANQVSTKTYGLRCAGVYSIGSNESWVYCFNSSLKSYLDAALCSATGGYIMAYNCDVSGVMGIKTRAGGDISSKETGVHVYNSRVAACYDADEMKKAYDVADPSDWDDSILTNIKNKGATSISQLNIFLDKANSPSFKEDSLNWWFTDKSKTPGYSGGNKFSVIYCENSSTPVYVNSSKLINQNYEEYGDASKLTAGQTPADNLLISVEGAGNANVYFTNENSSTKWDLTGQNNDTCELNGDFYLGAYSESTSGSPDIGKGSNKLNVNFVNSEWTGTILYGDTQETGTANLTLDAASSWKVTEDTTVADLEAADISKITADKAVTVTYTASSSIKAGTYGNVTFVKSDTK